MKRAARAARRGEERWGFWLVARAGGSILLFLASLLAVVPAPTTTAWLLSVAVIGWGWVLAIAALVLLAIPRRGRWGNLASILNAATVVLALSPLVRSLPVARALRPRLAVFGDTLPRTYGNSYSRWMPLSLFGLFSRQSAEGVLITSETYASRHDGPLHVDVYRRPTVSAAPLVVMVHGGSWNGGTRKDLAPLNLYLAQRGYVVASPEYRFAPKDEFPAARDDIRDAVAYLRTNAGRLGIDPGKVVLMGRSAGGELALLVAYTTPNSGIVGAIGYYAPSDLAYGFAHPSNPHVLSSTRVLSDYLGGTPQTVPAAYTDASPISFARDAVPTLLLHGDADELVSVMQSIRLDSALAANHRKHLLIRLPAATHGCDYNFAGDCAQIGTFAVERFLAGVAR